MSEELGRSSFSAGCYSGGRPTSTSASYFKVRMVSGFPRRRASRFRGSFGGFDRGPEEGGLSAAVRGKDDRQPLLRRPFPRHRVLAGRLWVSCGRRPGVPWLSLPSAALVPDDLATWRERFQAAGAKGHTEIERREDLGSSAFSAVTLVGMSWGSSNSSSCETGCSSVLREKLYWTLASFGDEVQERDGVIGFTKVLATWEGFPLPKEVRLLGFGAGGRVVSWEVCLQGSVVAFPAKHERREGFSSGESPRRDHKRWKSGSRSW